MSKLGCSLKSCAFFLSIFFFAACGRDSVTANSYPSEGQYTAQLEADGKTLVEALRRLEAEPESEVRYQEAIDIVFAKKLAGKFYTKASKEELADKAGKAKNLQSLVDTKEILDGILDRKDAEEDSYSRIESLRDLLTIKKHISQINDLQDTWMN